MPIRQLHEPPTSQEVRSFRDAYRRPPWYEETSEEAAAAYLAKFRAVGSLALAAYEDDASDPFLYGHFTTYGSATDLIADEFTGSSAFYRVTQPAPIVQRLEGRGTIAFWSSVHADTAAPIKLEHKPRLGLFSTLADQALELTGAQCVVLYTHHTTPVYEACKALDPSQYDVTFLDYGVEASDHTDITELALITITPTNQAVAD